MRHLSPLLILALSLSSASTTTAAPLACAQEQKVADGAEPSAGWVAGATSTDIMQRVVVLELTFDVDKAVKNKKLSRSGPDAVAAAVAIDDGLLLTSYARLQGAKKIVAMTGKGSKNRRTVELAATAIDDDLALLRATGNVDKDSPLPWTSLPLAKQADGDPTSSERFTLFLDPRAPKKARVLARDDLPIDGDEMGAGEVARLLGSLPILDASGALHGVWRWAPPGSSIAYAETNEIESLVAFAKSGKEPREASFKRAPSHTFPLVRWKRGSKKSANNAASLADKLAVNCACSSCHGRGKHDDSEDEIEKGRRRTKDQKVVCPTCDGKNLGRPVELWSALRTLAASYCLMDSTAKPEDLNRALEHLEDGVAAAAAHNPRDFRARVRDRAAEALAARKAVPGTALCFLVNEAQWPSEDIGDWEIEVHPLVIGDNHVLLVGASAMNVPDESRDAFVLGMVTGTIEWDSEQWVVIERAIGVPLKHER